MCSYIIKLKFIGLLFVFKLEKNYHRELGCSYYKQGVETIKNRWFNLKSDHVNNKENSSQLCFSLLGIRSYKARKSWEVFLIQYGEFPLKPEPVTTLLPCTTKTICPQYLMKDKKKRHIWFVVELKEWLARSLFHIPIDSDDALRLVCLVWLSVIWRKESNVNELSNLS